MSHQQMKERCPSAHFLKRTYLENFRFVYDGNSQKRRGSVANIIKLSGNKVWGGLFEISVDNLATLDYYEGYPTSYNRAELDIKDDTGNSITAVVYFHTNKDLGEPSEQYRKVILQGARDCGLPEEYIKSL